MRFTVSLAVVAATVSALPVSDNQAVSGTPVWKQHSLGLEGRKDLSYKERVLLQHNLHRGNHSVGKVTWDSNLAGWAKILAEKCVFAHDV